MALLLTHPEIPTCADCQKYIFDGNWKQLTRGKDREGKPLPVLRPAGSEPPCYKCPKSEDGRPNPGAELSARNWLAYLLYLEIQAGRPAPEDEIVYHNGGIILGVVEAVERQAAVLLPMMLTTKGK